MPQAALNQAVSVLGNALMSALEVGSGVPAASRCRWRAACSDVLVRRLVLRFALVRAALLMHTASREWSATHPE